MEDSSPASVGVSTTDEPPTSESVEPSTERLLSQRELVRLEFYRTYDVMTGVRIAATLGGFFGLMVLLVLYKSRCKGRSLSDEHLEAAITAVVEDEKIEEDMDVMAALTEIQFYGPRRSLGNMSAPPYMRFASFAGGVSSMMHPPAAKSVFRGRASLPVSDVRYHLGNLRASGAYERDLMSRPPAKVYKEEEEDEEDDSFEEGAGNFLRVPGSSRRLSSITCSSSDASYLYQERRTSAFEMGFPPPRPSICKTDKNPLITEAPWDFYYPIDIQVIQPTPDMTPTGSEVNLYNYPEDRSKTTLSVPKLAPLASMTSSGMSTDPEVPSVTVSDTVFIDEGPDVDTEDEIEDELSTDSEVEHKYTVVDKECLAKIQQNPSMNPFGAETDDTRDVIHAMKTSSRTGKDASRRFSAPTDRKLAPPRTGNPRLVPFSSTGDDDEQFPVCSKTVLGLTQIAGPEAVGPEMKLLTIVKLESSPERPETTQILEGKEQETRFQPEEETRLQSETRSFPASEKPETRHRPEVIELEVKCRPETWHLPEVIELETRLPSEVIELEAIVQPEMRSPPEVEPEPESVSRISSSSTHARSVSLSESREIRTSDDSATSASQRWPLPALKSSSSSCSISDGKHYNVPGSALSRSLDRLRTESERAPMERDAGADQTTGFNLTGFSIPTSHSCDHLVQNIQGKRFGVNKSLPALQTAWSQETLF